MSQQKININLSTFSGQKISNYHTKYGSWLVIHEKTMFFFFDFFSFNFI